MDSFLLYFHTGIILQRIDDQVWLFNVGQIPIFVNSPTLEDTTSGISQSPPPSSHPPCTTESPFTVHKVLPGHTVKAFDFARSKQCQASRRAAAAALGPYDPYAVRVSFGKGWGSNYQRQDATNCPCWLEVLLVAPPRPNFSAVSSTNADLPKKAICNSATDSDR